MPCDVSVVLTYLKPDSKLQMCLKSLEEQDYSEFEIVAVDGREGFTEGQGVIEGIKRAKGRYIAFTNADCRVPKNWLPSLKRWLDVGYDIAGGPRETVGDIYSYAWNVPYLVLSGMRSGMGFGWSNCMARKSAFQKVKLKDIRANQDLDFLIRAYKANLRIINDPHIVVIHDHPLKSLRHSMRRQMLASENYTYLLRHYHGSIAAPGLGLQIAFLRYMRGFLTAGRLEPRYGSLVQYCFVRFWVKIAQLCGFFLGMFRNGIVDVHPT